MTAVKLGERLGYRPRIGLGLSSLSVNDGDGPMLRASERDRPIEPLDARGRDEALAYGVALEELEHECGAARVERTEHVVEQEQRRLVEAITEEKERGEPERKPEEAMLTLRGVGPHVEPVEPEGHVVEVRTRKRPASLAFTPRDPAQLLAEPLGNGRLVRCVGHVGHRFVSRSRLVVGQVELAEGVGEERGEPIEEEPTPPDEPRAERDELRVPRGEGTWG